MASQSFLIFYIWANIPIENNKVLNKTLTKTILVGVQAGLRWFVVRTRLKIFTYFHGFHIHESNDIVFFALQTIFQSLFLDNFPYVFPIWIEMISL